MHVCIYAYIHWLSYLRTYIPLYLHTSIPLYLHTFIPIFIPLYLRTYIHTLHCTAVHYITVHYITYMYEYVHTYIVGGCMHCGCTATLDTWTDYANLVEYFAEKQIGISWDLTISYKKDLWPIYSLVLCLCKHYMNQSYMLIHPYPKSYSLYKCILDPYALMPYQFLISSFNRNTNSQ